MSDREKIANRFQELETSREKAIREGNNAWADQLSGELVGLAWVLNNCELPIVTDDDDLHEKAENEHRDSYK